VRLVVVTQTVDADHPALAQTVDIVRALADRCEGVDVLCDRVGRHSLPDNVAFRTFAAGSRLGRGLRFARGLAGVLRARPDGVLVHMVPTFLVLAAPLARTRRVPLLLWYTHWHASRSLRLATTLADLVLSVDRRSFPVETPKVRGIGHAIDVDVFTPAPAGTRGASPLRLLALGRIARWKGYDTMLEALRLAGERGLDATLEIRGPELTADERAHRAELDALVRNAPALAGRVAFAAPVPRDQIPELLRSVDALLSATQPTASQTLDKVVFEAAACGLPVVASNSALDEFLGGLPVDLRFQPRDAEGLAARLADLAAASSQTRAAVGAELRRRVVEGHSLDHWADAVVASVSEAGARGRPE
jgi:glycosyltransferase involved in cell wall biosynthesis